jgi:hypothetical protein
MFCLLKMSYGLNAGGRRAVRLLSIFCGLSDSATTGTVTEGAGLVEFVAEGSRLSDDVVVPVVVACSGATPAVVRLVAVVASEVVWPVVVRTVPGVVAAPERVGGPATTVRAVVLFKTGVESAVFASEYFTP